MKNFLKNLTFSLKFLFYIDMQKIFSKKFLVVLLLLSIVFSLSVFAEENKVLTYEEALNIAHRNSAMYKIADITRDNTILSASLYKDWIPSIGLSSSLYNGSMSSIGPLSDGVWNTNPSSTLNFGLSVSLSLNASKIWDAISLGATNESANATYAKTTQTYDMNVYSSYWALKGYMLSEEAAAISYNNAKTAADNVEKKYTQGRVSSLDAANARLSLSKAESTLLSATSNRKQAMISFKNLIGYTDKDDFELEEIKEPQELELPPSAVLYNQFINKSYDVRKARADEKSAENAASSLAWTYRTPSISASLGWGVAATENTFNASNYKDNLSFSLTASMSLDGFIPGTASYTNIKSAENSASIARLNRENTENTLLSNIESAVGSINSNYSAYNSAKITLESAEESYRLTKDAFDNGKVTMESYMNAEAALLNARIGVITANMTYMLSVQNLATTLGININELEQRYLKSVN